MSEQSETTDPADLPFGAPFAAWVKANVTAKAVVNEDGNEPSALRRAIGNHADRRAKAGMMTAMEDMLYDAINHLRDSAQQWRRVMVGARREVVEANPLDAFNSHDIADPRPAIISSVRTAEAARHLHDVVDAYVSTADKLATIGDEERARVAQRRVDARERRRGTLLAQSLETLRAIAAKGGAVASGARKGPYVEAILQREFSE